MRNPLKLITAYTNRQVETFVFERLLSRVPVYHQPTVAAEVRVLLCHDHVRMFGYSLDSFFRSINETLPVLVVDDGSLTAEDKKLLHSKFLITIYSPSQLLKLVAPHLKTHQHLKKYLHDQKTHIKKLRIALLLLPGTQVISYEADMLFFRFSPEIKTWIKKRSSKGYYLSWDWFTLDYFKRHSAIDVNFRKLIARSLKLPSPISFNAGLSLHPRMLSSYATILDKACALFYDIDYIYNAYADEVLLSLVHDQRRDKAFDSQSYKTVWSQEHYTAVPNDPILVHFAGEAKTILEKTVVKNGWQKLFLQKEISYTPL